VPEGGVARELKVGSGFVRGAGLGRLLPGVKVTRYEVKETQAAGSCRNTGMGRARSYGFMRHTRKEGAENGVGCGPRLAVRSLAWAQRREDTSRKREPEEYLEWDG